MTSSLKHCLLFAIPILLITSLVFGFQIDFPIEVSPDPLGAVAALALVGTVLFAGHRLFNHNDATYVLVFLIGLAALSLWLLASTSGALTQKLVMILSAFLLLGLLGAMRYYRLRFSYQDFSSNPAAG